MDKRNAVIAAIITAVVLGWFFRYERVGGYGRTVYLQNRWTGTVYVVPASEMRRMQ